MLFVADVIPSTWNTPSDFFSLENSYILISSKLKCHPLWELFPNYQYS